ncbi:MAG TPA: hypothetical protein VK178_01865 [Opitutaceae bacterium]|nr:hypothetical protein [Opitutaceae bacterium]
MTFTCAHHDVPEDWCQLLKTDCVPGRPGCVLRGKSVFLVPVEERIREKAQARRARTPPDSSASLRPSRNSG